MDKSKVAMVVMVVLAAAGTWCEGVGAGKGDRESERVSFYMHDLTLYKNASFDTGTVDVPASKDIGSAFQFGKLYIFDDQITSGPSSSSPTLGAAQGMYAYCGRSNMSAFWAFTAFFDHDHDHHQHQHHRHRHRHYLQDATTQISSISFMGTERVTNNVRFLPVVGGTGSFASARGVATITTIAQKVPSYFVLSFDVQLSY